MKYQPPPSAQKHARSPLHPALVHLPVALLPLSALLDLASRLWEAPELMLVQAAFITLVAGIATAVIAAVAGMMDYTAIREDHPAKRTATLHMVLNLIAVGLYCASLGLRWANPEATSTAWAPLAASGFATALLGCSGYLGGKLVYNDGVGVGRGRRATPLPARTIERVPAEPWALIDVAPTPLVEEGCTARVAVGDTIATVARTRGRLCAFQEFCTHRQGPLSEGRIVGGQVVCPWHASRFNAETGEVIQGPAKVALRTFPVDEHGGKVWLQVEDDDGSRQAERKAA